MDFSIPPTPPIEMRRNNRPIISEFTPAERLFFRFQQTEGDGIVPVQSVRFPSQSVNRESLGPPQWVLVPKYPRFADWGVAAFTVNDVPERIASPPPGNVTFDFRVEHDPLPDNYPHCEVRAFRAGEQVRDKKKINDSVKLRYRILVARASTIVRSPVAR